jgi:hypothetical protein
MRVRTLVLFGAAIGVLLLLLLCEGITIPCENHLLHHTLIIRHKNMGKVLFLCKILTDHFVRH